MFRSEAGNIGVFVSACFTAGARCSSSCNESTLCWACRNVFCRVEVYWPSWQLAVLMKRAQVFRMKRVQDADSAFTVQYLYSAFTVASALWNHPTGPDANMQCLGRGWAVPHALECLYFPSLRPPWGLESEGRICKLLLLPVFCSYKFSRYPHPWQGRMVEMRWSKRKGGAAEVSMAFTGNCVYGVL